MPHKFPSASQIVRSATPKLIVSWLVVILFQVMGHSWLSELVPVVAMVCFIGLFGTIIMAAFGVVHEADELAHQLGEPYGTLVLILSIVSIEVILIAAVMLGPGESATIGRDSIYVAYEWECPPCCKVEISDWSRHSTSTSPDLSG